MIQIDMKMPDGCANCNLCADQVCSGFGTVVPSVVYSNGKKPSWCPLKEPYVLKGRWIGLYTKDDESSQARCSMCGRASDRPYGNYCKWCGAKMDI